MANNAAHADREWERLAKRGWICSLKGPFASVLPWVFKAEWGKAHVIERAGTTRVEAVIIGAKAVEDYEKEQVWLDRHQRQGLAQ